MIKKGVKIAGIKPEILLGLITLHQVFNQFEAELILTAVTDGKHKTNSLHYKGQAIDIRARHLKLETAKEILQFGKESLGDNFDFILEGVGTPNIHFHLEYDPEEQL